MYVDGIFLARSFCSCAHVHEIADTGKMPPVDRAAATTRIKQDPTCTVILVSIKAGAVGLNLTCCSRVILLDLWSVPEAGHSSIHLLMFIRPIGGIRRSKNSKSLPRVQL